MSKELENKEEKGPGKYKTWLNKKKGEEEKENCTMNDRRTTLKLIYTS